MRREDFDGAYGECMYLLFMAIRPEALPTDAAVLTEMVLALERGEVLSYYLTHQLKAHSVGTLSVRDLPIWSRAAKTGRARCL